MAETLPGHMPPIGGRPPQVFGLRNTVCVLVQEAVEPVFPPRKIVKNDIDQPVFYIGKTPPQDVFFPIHRRAQPRQLGSFNLLSPEPEEGIVSAGGVYRRVTDPFLPHSFPYTAPPSNIERRRVLARRDVEKSY